MCMLCWNDDRSSSLCTVRVNLGPVIRDLLPGSEPDALMLLGMLNKLPQPNQTSRTTDKPGMQPNRHHLRLACLSFAVQLVECANEVRSEIVGRKEGIVVPVLVIVGVQPVYQPCMMDWRYSTYA